MKFDAKFTVALGHLGAVTGNKGSSEGGGGLFDAAEKEFEVILDYWRAQSNFPNCWQLSRGKPLSLLTYCLPAQTLIFLFSQTL